MEQLTKKNREIFIYCMTVLGGLFLFWIYRYAGTRMWGLDYPYNSFTFLPKDQYMDFFHINSMSAGGSPYQEGSSYPPLALVFALLFSKLIPGSKELDPFVIRNTNPDSVLILQIMYMVCLVFSLILFAICFLKKHPVKEIIPKEKFIWNIVKSIVFPLLSLGASMFLAAPMIYSLDRGNYLILCFLFLFLFVFLYENHPNLSALALAVASSLKMYPVVLFLVFFFDRKYRPFWTGILFGGGMTAFSFLFFNGSYLDKLKHFIWNILNFTGGRPMTHVYYFRDAIGIRSLLAAPFLLIKGYIPDWLNISVLGIIAGICLFIAVIFMCIWERRYERQILYLTLFVILFPTPSYYYNITYLIPSVFLLLLKKEKLEWYIPVLTGLLMIPKNYFYIAPFFFDVNVLVSVGNYIDPLLMGLLLLIEFIRILRSDEKIKIKDRFRRKRLGQEVTG